VIKKLQILFLFSLISGAVFCQIDSAIRLKALLPVEKTDTGRIKILWRLAEAMNNYKPDSAIKVAQTALYESRNISYTDGESRSLGVLSNALINMSNYPQALEFSFQKLRLDEKANNPYNLASVLINIGVIYVLQEEYPAALKYYRQADSVIQANGIEKLKYYTKQNLGDIYDRLHFTDSAFVYFSEALNIALERKNNTFIGASYTGLAHVNIAKVNYTESLNQYRNAVDYLTRANDDELLCEATLGFAELFHQLNRSDSALYYAKWSLALAKKAVLPSREMDAAEFLSRQFNTAGHYDSAYIYLTKVQVINDSINSKTRIKEIQILSSNEQVRQAEIAEAKRLAQKEREKQLQLLIIGLFIPAFFFATLLLSRIRIHRKVIAILGILSLLILFEFLTLLLHPFVAELTNHKPVLEILIFVTLAAILIPGHHRLERWLIDKLTQYKQGDNRFSFKRKKMTVKIKKDPDQV